MKFHLALVAVALIISQNVFAQGCPGGLAYDTDVSVFDSSTVGDGTTIFPIGGSGISNGHFAACNGTGVQVGGRISERFVGPITPNAGTADYVAPIGDHGDGTALWNIEGHIDFGFAYADGGAPPNSLGDIGLTMETIIDCNPYIDVIEGPSAPINLIPDTAVLIQFSQNLGFLGACKLSGFDPTADGHYAFVATLKDASGAILATHQVNAIVGSPVMAPPTVATPSVSIPTLSQWALFLLSMLLGLVAFGRLRRKT